MIDSTTQQTILFVVQILSLIFLIIYVIKTWEMASATRKAAEATEKSVVEMRETRDQETAPFIVAYFDTQSDAGLIYLIVKNIGRTVATHVKFSFTPQLQASRDSLRLQEVGFIKNGVESMPPNYEIRTLVDATNAYFGKKELPLTYDVKITYFGGLESKQREIHQPLDLSANKGISYVRNKTMDDLVSEVETLGRELHELRNSTSNIAATLEQGIYISNPSLLVTGLEPDSKNWKKLLITKLNEFENLWKISYRDAREEGMGLGGLQPRLLIISDQILLLRANKINRLPTDVLEKTSVIAGKLRELGQLQFYADSGLSLQKFNELGDSIIADISDIRAKSA